MKYLRSIAVIVLCLCLALFSFVGCSTTKSTKKITLNEVTHSIFYAPQYVAIEKGYFKEEGLEVTLVNGGGADKSMTAVLSGEADIGLMGPEAAIYVYNQGKEDYVKVFGQLTKRDGSFLFGKETASEFKWSNLKGKTVIGGRLGGVPEMTVEYVLKQQGFKLGVDVKVDSSIQFNLMASAYQNGVGDYVTLFEPTASALEAAGKGHVLISIGSVSGEIPYTAYMAKSSYIKNNSDTIQAFTNAVYKGQKFVKEHTAAEIAAIIKPQFPDTTIESLTISIQRYKDADVWNDTPVMKEAAFNKLQDVMQEAKQLDKRADYKSLIDNTFAEKSNKITLPKKRGLKDFRPRFFLL